MTRAIEPIYRPDIRLQSNPLLSRSLKEKRPKSPLLNYNKLSTTY